MNYFEFAVSKLKENDYKLTVMRESVLRLLNENSMPFTPYEVKDELLKKGVKADVVTLYRVFEVFEKIGLVHKVSSLGRYIPCYVQGEANMDCHHYVICKLCKKIEEVEGEDLHSLEAKIQRNLGFKVESHYLEFNGVCNVCLTK